MATRGSDVSGARWQAGGEAEQLTTDSSAHFWPRWSPDGREIAYHGFAGGRRQLFVMSADGGRPSPVPTGGGDARAAERSPDGRRYRPLYLSWAADGRTLYYLALDSVDHASVWGIDLRSAARRELVRLDDPERDWHRYGFGAFRDRLYMTRGISKATSGRPRCGPGGKCAQEPRSPCHRAGGSGRNSSAYGTDTREEP